MLFSVVYCWVRENAPYSRYSRFSVQKGPLGAWPGPTLPFSGVQKSRFLKNLENAGVSSKMVWHIKVAHFDPLSNGICPVPWKFVFFKKTAIFGPEQPFWTIFAQFGPGTWPFSANLGSKICGRFFTKSHKNMFWTYFESVGAILRQLWPLRGPFWPILAQFVPFFDLAVFSQFGSKNQKYSIFTE